MARWAPARKDTISALADELLHNYGRGRVLVAIDGPDGAGKSTFADDLAALLREKGHEVFRATVDDFHRPYERAIAEGEFNPEGWYRHAYDYDMLRRALVEPFRTPSSGAFVLAGFDSRRDQPIQPKWITAGTDAILIVDGVFLNRPELRGLWNFTVWLDVSPELGLERYSRRDGTSPDADAPLNRRYLGAQEFYQSHATPRARANAIIDNTDVEHPRRVFADSC
ncbi:MAG: uridine kinase [Glaciihabitans sp.]|jgi:uridine kinase|nr:uridine kinase [Glaciihabitans sp.]